MTQYPWQHSANPPRATDADFAAAARQLGCSVAEIKAVWRVEAAGRPFRRDGSVERRFEPHHFPRDKWGLIWFSVRAGEAPWRASLRLSNDAMAERAYATDPDAMLHATSFGGPQIMGFNAEQAGHITARDMVEAMARGERAHLMAFTTLINNWGLASAIRAHDWERFARRYNGPGQVARYATLLERAYGVTSTQKHAVALEKAYRTETGHKSKVVLRIGAEGAAVRTLQAALGIKVDGVFGRQTYSAVREFQRANGLIADGVVGARTWGALEQKTDKVAKVPVQPATETPPSAPGMAAAAAIPALATAAATGGGLSDTTILWVAAAIGIVAAGAALVWWWRR